MIYSNVIYCRKPERNEVLAMINSEIRSLIQNWRKQNKLPVDFRIPTLKIYYRKNIIGAALRWGYTDVGTDKHLFETCLVDRAEADYPEAPTTIDTTSEVFNKDLKNIFDPTNGFKVKNWDIIFWSPNGGNYGFGNILTGNVPCIQEAIDYVIEHEECYDHAALCQDN